MDGQVIHVEAPFMARPHFRWGKFLVTVGLIVGVAAILGPVILAVVIALFAFSFLLSFLLPRRTGGGHGFLTSVASQVVGFFLTSKLLGRKADVPIRDFRIRDLAGQQHLVRIEGELRSGNVNVGDEVTVEGYNRGGTLMMSRGFNKRIRSVIEVKLP